MATRTKITVSLDMEIVKELRLTSRRERIPKSRIVEQALLLWKRERLNRELEQGYRSMAEEDSALAEELLPVARKDWE